MADDPDTRLGKDSRLKRYDDIRDMIGDPENPTPIVALRRMLPRDSSATLYVKLEWMNPFGSVKDRPAKWMLEAMEERGELDGRTILEPTSRQHRYRARGDGRAHGPPDDRDRSRQHALREDRAAARARRRGAVHA